MLSADLANPIPTPSELAAVRHQHAQAIAVAGSLEAALAQKVLPNPLDTTLSEALVLGLLRQGVRTFLCVLGHGSTEIGEVLRIYQAAGLVRTLGVRNEIAASHAATALRWVRNEKAAVLTSIGPGALQALAASIAPSSDAIGIWYLFGDETSEDEGPNMQQIPKHEQNTYLQLCATMGQAYTLHTPLALGTALRRGLNTVDHPHQAGPFYLLMPLNTQPAALPNFNLETLPTGAPPPLGAASATNNAYQRAAHILSQAQRVVLKIGGGGRHAGPQLIELLDRIDGVAVTSPLVSGVLPYNHPRNMTVGGSKGSICGNYAMEHADTLVVIGSRAVCQSDCSRTGYPQVQQVININTDATSATHYGRTLALIGDAAQTLTQLCNVLPDNPTSASTWLQKCTEQKNAWNIFKSVRYEHPTLFDPVWNTSVLTQPAAIKTAADWARQHDVISFYDAGDVQANGFQVVEDDCLGRTFTETGASYMGFAVSALLATALTDSPFYGLAFTGDGSFTMNPQILIDGIAHGAQGCILLLDNRRMGAISGLQLAQYGAAHATNDQVEIDYIHWAKAIKGVAAFDAGNNPTTLCDALDQAHHHQGLSLIYVRVYFGPDELGGLGAFGRWNVGNWCNVTQAMRHQQGL